MTAKVETKSLSEENLSSEGLNIPEPAKEFLNFPHKEKFMSNFIIGSNGLQLYGIVPVMAQHSPLIKSSLDNYANSQQPYPLLTFGVVLERPMTILWFYLNNVANLDRKWYISLEEWLHLYRLMDYFQMDLKAYPLDQMLIRYSANSVEDNKKALSDEKNQVTFFKLVNKDIIDGEWGNDYMAHFLQKFPSDMLKHLRFIPVYVNDVFKTYADRKFVEEYKNRHNKRLGVSNQDWMWIDDSTGGYFRLIGAADWIKKLYIEAWGPDDIRLKYVSEMYPNNPFANIIMTSKVKGNELDTIKLQPILS